MTATVAGGVWGMTNSNATISAGGIVTGATAGVDTVTYAVTNICGTQTATTTITVDAYPVAGVISGPSVVCVGGTATLTETVAGGAWSSSSALTTVSGTGVVTGVTAGTDTISYTVTNSCGTVGTSQVMTILGLPAPGAISSPASSICVGGMATMTDPTPGGIWSSTNGAIATVAGGVVTGVAAGSDTILYSMTNTCGTVSSSMPITVVNFPTAGVISGPSMVCDGSAITLLDSAPGGIWAASNGNATLLAPGIVSGVTVGTDTIFYSVTNVCGTASVNTIISIDPVPVVSPISGPSTLCVSSIASLLDATSGGTWTSSTPGLVTIDVASGLMTGLSVGTSTITYTVTNAEGCPTSVTQTETVNAAPVIPAITGTLSECVGGTSMLSDSLAGGTWSSSNTAVATIDATGNVTGVTAGSATITYTVSGTCGSSFVTATDVVNALPTVAAISGSTSGCVGMANTLADATSGGVWSSSDNTIATVSATGVVTGIAPGTATIFYTVTNTAGCTAQASVSYTVNGLPVVAAITGIMSECIGGSQLLSDGTSGGTWSSSNTAVATVDGSGNVTGISAGIASISYTVTNGAGCMASATASDTVLSTPVSSPITGTLSVCVGATTALGNGVPYGTWSSSNTAVATVDAVSGVVTGVSVGSATIMYNVTNMCGSITDNATVNVMATPTVAPVTATTATLCAGATTTVSDVTAGGTWSVSDSTIATINPTTGVVTGYGMGIVTVTYTVVNTAGCFGDATATLDFGSSIGSSYISPSSATICDGHTVYLQVLTSGTGLSYQWLYNGVAIPGATNNNYTADTAGNYSAIVSNGTCTETLAGAMVVNMSTPGIGMTPPNVLYTGSYASYQWYLNGSAIPGATNSIYVETAPGVYQVAVSDASGCTLTSATDTVASGSGSGVAIINYASQIRLYPNPATSVLSIVSPVTVNAKVMSPDGKMVIEQKNASKVDVSGLSDGLYIIMIYDENDLLLKTDKFMKLN